MSRYIWEGADSTPVLTAAEYWKDRCLLNNKSVFTDKELWTHENFNVGLQNAFIENLDTGTGTFIEKLKSHLEYAPGEVKQLMAEIYWIMYLLKNGKPETKIKKIKEIWRWSGEELDDKKIKIQQYHLTDTLGGLIGIGTGFQTHIHRELYYFILFFQKWTSKNRTEKEALLSDAWKFGEYLERWEKEQEKKSLPITMNRTTRHALLYTLFPDTYEAIVAIDPKRQIVKTFAKESATHKTKIEIDRMLFDIRNDLAKEEKWKNGFTFYQPELKKKWRPGEIQNHDTEIAYPLNQILQGPPGTGKTYITKEIAVKIIDGPDIPGDRKSINTRYEELRDEGKIRFVTFHQSYGYEDFVEGIKPKMVEGNIAYRVEPGIFKEICSIAQRGEEDYFGDAIESIEELRQESKNKILSGFATIWHKKKFNIVDKSKNTFYIIPESSTNNNPNPVPIPVSIEGVRTLYMTGEYDGHFPSYVRGVYDYMREKLDLKEYKQSDVLPGNYVLIIDEINRGNISKILGELITLLEEDKRIGNDEALSVTLPYSQELFGVPNNLYIIGTMNTADRSIAFLDTALRRRFHFEEVMPDPTLLKEVNIEGIEIEKLLEQINKKIKKLLDRDHQIGHSYFLKLKQLSGKDAFEKLQEIFEHNIIPLLREYYFEQDDDIAEILGKGFCKTKEGKMMLREGQELKDVLNKPGSYQEIYKNAENKKSDDDNG